MKYSILMLTVLLCFSCNKSSTDNGSLNISGTDCAVYYSFIHCAAYEIGWINITNNTNYTIMHDMPGCLNSTYSIIHPDSSKSTPHDSSIDKILLYNEFCDEGLVVDCNPPFDSIQFSIVICDTLYFTVQ